MLWFLFLGFSSYSADNCAPDMREATASVTIGFNYKDSPLALRMTSKDAQFYHDQIGAAVSKKPKLISDADVLGRGKDAFLSLLKKQVAGKEFVVFNYAGHGVRYTDKRWAMILPGLPQKLVEECKEFLGPMIEGKPVPPDTQGCLKRVDPFMVTDEDLRGVFEGKKVLAFNDSCMAGQANLGNSTVHVPAALADQPALDQLTLSAKNGAMTSRIRSQFNECHWDSNKDGQMSAEELTSRYAVYRPGQEATSRRIQPKRVSVYAQSGERVPVFDNRGLLLDDGRRVKIEDKKQPSTAALASAGLQQMSLQNHQSWLKCLNLGAVHCQQPSSGGRSSGSGSTIEK